MKFDATSGFVESGFLKITQQERDYLRNFLDRGDRGGYYMALYNMTGVTQALEQAQIATFSEGTGGVAFVANFLLQNGLADDYAGVYYLSQAVAEESLIFIEKKLDANEEGNTHTGFISVQDMFNTAATAWRERWKRDSSEGKDLERYFPGNFLDGILGWMERFEDFDLEPLPNETDAMEAVVTVIGELWNGQELNSTSFINRLISTGALSGLLASFPAAVFGKQLSDYEAHPEIYSIYELPDAKYKVAVAKDNGKVVGVFNNEFIPTNFSEVLNRLAANAPAILAAMVGGAPAGLSMDILTNFLRNFLSDFHRMLSESHPGFNGDINSVMRNDFSTAPALQAPLTFEATGLSETLWGEGGWIGALHADTFHAGEGDDRVFGGDGGDELYGDAGADLLYGQAGDDTLHGGAQDDVVRGGDGDDELYGGAGNDLLDGDDLNPESTGNDKLYGEDGNDQLSGGRGDDTLSGGNDDDTLAGADGLDALHGDEGADYLDGGADNDELWGDSGNDTLLGGTGNDTLDGGEDQDTLIGGEGNDTLIGGIGNDQLDGGSGDDSYYFVAGDGKDVVVDKLGVNSIYLNGKKIDKLLYHLEQAADFFDEDGNLYHRSGGGDLVAIPVGGAGDTVTIKNFFNGAASSFENAFGVTVEEKDSPQVTQPVQPGSQFTVGSGLLGQAYYYNHDSEEYVGSDYWVYASFEGRESTFGWRDDQGNSLDQSYINGLGILFVADDYLHRHPVDPYYAFEGGSRDDVLLGNWVSRGLYGLLGNDYIKGAGNNDWLEGGTGNDTVLGGTGSDLIFLDDRADKDAGGDGDDYADGGAGNDRISGAGGNDYIVDMEGSNFLGGGSGRDTLIAGGGNDVIAGDGYVGFADGLLYGLLQAGSSLSKEFYDDFINAGDGDNRVFGGAGADTIIAGSGNDTVHGDMSTLESSSFFPSSSYVALPSNKHGDDKIYVGAGDDIVIGGGGNDFISGGEGNDSLWGDELSETDIELVGNDVLFGGSGDDQLSGGGGDDLLFGETGNDSIWGGGGNDFLQGGEGNDYLEGDYSLLDAAYHGKDTLDGGIGDDTLFGGGNDDSLAGGEGDDHLNGDDGDDSLLGGVGNDLLWGGAGNDWLQGGAGFDYFAGEAGDDTYVFNLGDGERSAEDYIEYIQDNEGDNSVAFGTGIGTGDIVLTQTADGGLHLRYSANDDLLLKDGLTGGVQTLKFADGSVHNLKEFYASTSQDEVNITTLAANAQLIGSAQANQLSAAGGGATFRGGHGDDILTADGGGNTYVYERGDGVDHIYDNSGFTVSAGPVAPNRILFGAGIRHEDVRLAVGADDTLEVVIAGEPAGKLVIHNFNAADAANGRIIDRFEFADGSALNYAALLGGGFNTVGGSGDDRLLGSNLNDQLFGQGGNDTLLAGAGDDLLDGGAGSDRLEGGAGADLYLYARGQGTDTLVEVDDGSTNTLRFAAGLAAADIELTADASRNLILKIKGTNDSLVLSNWLADGSALIQRIEFADGTVWTPDWILQNLTVQSGTEQNDVLSALVGQSTTLYGLAGNDTLNGSTNSDQLVGGAGDDLLNGGAGDDRYLIAAGDGADIIADTAGFDAVVYADGISPGDLAIEHLGNDLVLAHANGIDRLTLKDWYSHTDGRNWIEEIRFASGVVWSASQLTLWGLTQQGTAGDDYLNGVALFADTLAGGDGNDQLWGWGGDDILHGDLGDDTLQGGDGNDQLFGGAGDDFIDAGAGDDVIYGGDGNDYILTRGGQDVVYAGNGNDTIRAQGAAIIDAGEGDDFVGGDRLQFTIRYAAGYGSDSYYNFAHIEFMDMVRDDFSYLRAGNHLSMVSRSNAGDRIWQANFFRASSAADKASFFELRFSDGSSLQDIALSELNGVFLDARKIDNDSEWIDVLYYSTGYSPNADTLGQYGRLSGGGFFLGDSKLTDDYLIGSDAADTFTVQAGNDVVQGLGGNDSITLLDGNDTVIGGRGDDTIWLSGSGHKTLRYGVGDGADKISRYSSIATMTLDVAGYSLDQVTYERSGSDILLRFGGSTDSIRLQSFLDLPTVTYNQNFASDIIRFTDGQVLSASDLLLNVIASEQAPNAIEDSFTARANYPLFMNSYQLIQNDWDPEATSFWPLYLTGVSGAVNGQVFIDSSNQIVFIADSDFYGIASFSYGVSDYVKSSVGQVSVKVQKNYEVVSDSSVVIAASDLLRDDLIEGNEALEINYVSGSDELNVQYDRDTGLITLTPSAGFVGQVSFQYDWFDGEEYRYETAFVEVGSLLSRTLTGTSASDVLEGSFGNDTLNGSGGTDYLVGGRGNDRLNGGSGTDVMIGGAGNDTYVVDNAGDMIIEGLNGGIDTVETSISLTLAAHTENLLLTGSSAISGTGNELDNVLTGNSGANTLIGGAGNDRLDGKAGTDTMLGGLGDDTYVVERTTDVVTEYADEGIDTIESSVTLTLGDNIENLTLTGSAALNGTGNALDNILTGNSGKNTLTGGAGNDRLDGRGGIDTMRGGLGNDTYVVDTVSDVITENANEGIDTVESSVTLTLGNHVENLTLTGSSTLNGTGNALDNVLIGNAAANSLTGAAGDDRLDGQGGADTLTGGTGNDTYVLGRGYGADTAVENDATAGNTDVAQFLGGIDTDQLWFRKVSNNLEVSIIGTSDKLTVKDWYLGNAYHVEQFKTADGHMLLDSQVQNLVSAMAAFAPPAAGQITLPENYQADLSPVIAANWQ